MVEPAHISANVAGCGKLPQRPGHAEPGGREGHQLQARATRAEGIAAFGSANKAVKVVSTHLNHD